MKIYLVTEMALSVMTSVVWSLLTKDNWWAKHGFIFVSKVTSSSSPRSGFGDLGTWCRAFTDSFISFSPSHEFVPIVESNDNGIDGIFWQKKHGFKGAVQKYFQSNFGFLTNRGAVTFSVRFFVKIGWNNNCLGTVYNCYETHNK